MKKIYDIQGMKFALKPTTPNNVKRLREEGFARVDEANEKNPEGFSAYLFLLRYTTDPVSGDELDFDRIDVDELDLRQVEGIVADFLPRLMRISAALMS